VIKTVCRFASCKVQILRGDFSLLADLEKYSSVKFHENPSSRSRVVGGGGGTDRQTDRQTGVA
jgi:hypothetical protein